MHKSQINPKFQAKNYQKYPCIFTLITWCKGESCVHLCPIISWLHLQSSLGFARQSSSLETHHSWVYRPFLSGPPRGKPHFRRMRFLPPRFLSFMRGIGWLLLKFLVSLAIFSSCSLMCASFSSLSLTSRSSMAFMAAISSSKLFVPIVITSMTTVLEDSASVSDLKTCLSDGEEESLL